MLKKLVIHGIIISIIFFTSGCDVFNQAVQNAIAQTHTVESAQANSMSENPASTSKPANSYLWGPAMTSEPTEEQYIRAGEVTSDLAGQSIEVCGKVTYYGEESCPNCIYGYFAYFILDDNFYIISYDWTFNSGWVGSYFIAKDKVETMGSRPIFVYGGNEGWDGSECVIMPDGSKTCDAGDYFKFVPNCGG